VRLFDAAGHLLATSPDTPEVLHDPLFPSPIPATEVFGPTDYHRLPDGRWFLTLSAWTETPIAGQQWLLQVALDVTHNQTVLRRYRQSLILISLVGLSLFMAAVVGIVHYSLWPLRVITRTAQRVTAQRLDGHLVPLKWPKELSDLAYAFDSMLDRLAEAVSRLQQFSADLAHELRTPIQNLMWETEVTLVRERSAAEYQEGLTQNLEELKHLAAMVDDLLFLARAENPQRKLSWQPLDAIKALRDVWDFFDAVAEEQGIVVVYDGEGTVQAEPELFRRALTNLLSNALRHTPRGGTITLAAVPGPAGACRICVSDTGCGIAPEHLPKLFNRFYQVGRDRSPSTEGAGLGLAIVESIMTLHGGTVKVHSTLSQGTTFILYFPTQSLPVR
jgi:two-component system heavy metal sensor histidine kinase CusS